MWKYSTLTKVESINLYLDGQRDHQSKLLYRNIHPSNALNMIHITSPATRKDATLTRTHFNYWTWSALGSLSRDTHKYTNYPKTSQNLKRLRYPYPH